MPSEQSNAAASRGISRVSKHAAIRWLQRVGESDVGIRTAWRQSLTVPTEGLRGDEIRYHRETDTALVRMDETLVTVVEVESARRQLRWAVRHARGGGR